MLNTLFTRTTSTWVPQTTLTSVLLHALAPENMGAITDVVAVLSSLNAAKIVQIASPFKFDFISNGLEHVEALVAMLQAPDPHVQNILRHNQPPLQPHASGTQRGPGQSYSSPRSEQSAVKTPADIISSVHRSMKSYACYGKGTCAKLYIDRLEHDLKLMDIPPLYWVYALRAAFSRVPACHQAIQVYQHGSDDVANYNAAKARLAQQFGARPFLLANELARYANRLPPYGLAQTATESIHQYFTRFEASFTNNCVPLVTDLQSSEGLQHIQQFLKGVYNNRVRDMLTLGTMSKAYATYAEFHDACLNADAITTMGAPPLAPRDRGHRDDAYPARDNRDTRGAMPARAERAPGPYMPRSDRNAPRETAPPAQQAPPAYNLRPRPAATPAPASAARPSDVERMQRKIAHMSASGTFSAEDMIDELAEHGLDPFPLPDEEDLCAGETVDDEPDACE
jgi:hypothetical protein